MSRPGYANVTRSGMRGDGKNPHDAFVDLENEMRIILRSNKAKTLELLEKMGSKIYRYKYVRKETETLFYIKNL